LTLLEPPSQVPASPPLVWHRTSTTTTDFIQPPQGTEGYSPGTQASDVASDFVQSEPIIPVVLVGRGFFCDF
jgi:hypothetical protein